MLFPGFSAEMDSVTSELKSQSQDPKLQQTLELKLKRLITEQKVRPGANVTIQGCQIFLGKTYQNGKIYQITTFGSNIDQMA
jgi:hypothetical protein